ncbi:MAG: hypothetical protein DRZ80_02315, partial [Thermoprotei archaeon]
EKTVVNTVRPDIPIQKPIKTISVDEFKSIVRKLGGSTEWIDRIYKRIEEIDEEIRKLEEKIRELRKEREELLWLKERLGLQ